jgi:hypothetical protein
MLIEGLPFINLRAKLTAEQAKRGGDQRAKEIQELWNDSNCKRFADLVQKLIPIGVTQLVRR